MPKVSIIIPVYNVKLYIEEALDSVIYQTFQDLEILIIDDGSSDGSGEICDKYALKDKRISVLHQENRGLSAARNVGLNNMTGDYVAFLDPDDAFFPSMIQVMAGILEDKNIDLVECKYATYRTEKKMDNSEAESVLPEYPEGNYNRSEVLKMMMENVVWNKLYRSKLWEDIRFPEGHVYEDNATTIQILGKIRKARVISDVFVNHRRHTDSISETKSIQNILDYVWSWNQYEKYFRTIAPELYINTVSERVFSLRFYALIYLYIKHGKYELEHNLRRTIIEEGERMRGQRVGIKILFMYHMIRYCPRIFKRIYKIKNAFGSISQFVDNTSIK